jgi:hypothetical protein
VNISRKYFLNVSIPKPRESEYSRIFQTSSPHLAQTYSTASHDAYSGIQRDFCQSMRCSTLKRIFDFRSSTCLNHPFIPVILNFWSQLLKGNHCFFLKNWHCVGQACSLFRSCYLINWQYLSCNGAKNATKQYIMGQIKQYSMEQIKEQQSISIS